MAEQATYILVDGKADSERLRIMTEAFWPWTRGFLEKAGLQKNQSFLDLGCGNGANTVAIARHFSLSGKVHALDRSSEAVEIARQHAAKNNITATFSVADFEDESFQPEQHFDFIYARYLFWAIKDPYKLFSRVLNWLAPGGVIAIEDADHSGHFCEPSCRAFEQYSKWFMETVSKSGGSMKRGRDLLPMFQKFSLDEIQLTTVNPGYFTGEAKWISYLSLANMKDRFLESGIATPEEFAVALKEFKVFTENPSTIVGVTRTFQVSGRKR